MNTFGANFDEAQGVVAGTRIHHGEPRPSHLIVMAGSSNLKLELVNCAAAAEA